MYKPFYSVLPEVFCIAGVNHDLHRQLHDQDNNDRVQYHQVLQLYTDRDVNSPITLWHGVYMTTAEGDIDDIIRLRPVHESSVTMMMFLDLLKFNHPILSAYAEQLHKHTISNEMPMNKYVGNVMWEIYLADTNQSRKSSSQFYNEPEYWASRLDMMYEDATQEIVAPNFEGDDLITTSAQFEWTKDDYITSVLSALFPRQSKY